MFKTFKLLKILKTLLLSIYRPNLLFLFSEGLPADSWLPCRDEAPDDGLELACWTRLAGERCCCWGDSRGDAEWDDASRLLMLLARLSDEWCWSTRIKLSRSARSACMFFTLQTFLHFSRLLSSTHHSFLACVTYLSITPHTVIPHRSFLLYLSRLSTRQQAGTRQFSPPAHWIVLLCLTIVYFFKPFHDFTHSSLQSYSL